MPGNAPSDLQYPAAMPEISSPNAQTSTADTSSPSEHALVHGPAQRTHLSIPKHNFEALASRTVSRAILEETQASKLPASPLDSIDPSLYPRFPRFSITTDTSQPELSTDEVTSTKISLDEEGMMATRSSSNASNTKVSKRQQLQITLHRAVSTSSLNLKRIGERMRRAPSIFLARRTPKRPQRSLPECQAEVGCI